MAEELKENCLKIDCIHYSDYNGKCYKKENLKKEIRKCSDSDLNAVLADVRALPRYNMESKMYLGSSMERDDEGEYVEYEEVIRIISEHFS